MSVSQELGVDVDMDLEEDIGAELDYFIFLTLLGIDNEAHEFASTVLWPHLRHFPVLAEVSSYFIARNDIEELRRLLNHVEDADIRFDDPEESSLLTYLRLIEVEQDAVAYEWYRTAASLTESFNEWASETSCLILEIQMTIAARSRDASLFDFVTSITDHCVRLQRRQMYEHTARMFSIACSAIPEDLAHRYKNFLQKVFRQISNPQEQAIDRDQHSHEESDADNWSIYSILIKVSFLIILEGATTAAMEDGPNDSAESLLQQTEELLRNVHEPLRKTFEDLPNPTPRGRHFTRCERLDVQLEEMSLVADVLRTNIAPAHTQNAKLEDDTALESNRLTVAAEESSSFFAILLLPRGIASSEILISKAIESNRVNYNILSESVVKAHEIKYDPHNSVTGTYHTVGRVEFASWRAESSQDMDGPRVGYWYITPDELPGGAQAVVSTWALETRSGGSSLSEESLGTFNVALIDKNKSKSPTNPDRATARYLYQPFPR